METKFPQLRMFFATSFLLVTIVSPLCSYANKSSIDIKRQITPKITSGITPIYVTVVSHNERTGDEFSDSEAYQAYRASLLKTLKILKKYGAAYHHGSDYKFLDAVKEFDVPGKKAVKATNGKNVIRYLVEDYGFREDPHAHEDGFNNYADVTYRVQDLLGGDIPVIANGVNQFDLEQYGHLTNGESGISNPDFSWSPEIIFSPGIPNHPTCLERHYSGIWKATGTGQDYYRHDPLGKLTVIGKAFSSVDGELFDSAAAWASSADFIIALVHLIESGKAPSGKLYTANLFFNEKKMLEQDLHSDLKKVLQKLKTYVDEGKVVFKHADEIKDIWEREYGSEPNIFDIEKMSAYETWKSTNCP